MKIKKCPKCLSNELVLNVAGGTGKYECKKCGYVGVIIIEEDI